MTPTYKESASDREILLVGPYGVLGTGVIDAVAANSTMARYNSGAPACADISHPNSAPPH
jgi:hypothetical protein